MEMHQVRYFLAVCRTLNFTKAADECNVAQPSLTRAVQKLEEELGGLLFHRERQNTHLTNLGRAMQPHLQQTFDAAVAAKSLAAGFKKGEVAPLRFSIGHTIAVQPFTAIARKVWERIPNLEMTFLAGSEKDLAEAAAGGQLDLVILRVLHGQSPAMLEKFHIWPLFEEEPQVILAQGDALTARNMLGLTDLAGGHLILRDECAACERLMTLAAREGIGLTVRHRAQTQAQIESLVEAGFGFALLPGSMTMGHGVTTRPLDAPELRTQIIAAAVAGRPFSPAADAILKLMRARKWGAAV